MHMYYVLLSVHFAFLYVHTCSFMFVFLLTFCKLYIELYELYDRYNISEHDTYIKSFVIINNY